MVRYVSGNGNRFYSYADALGSIRLLSDSAGNIKESYTYDPYGRPRVMRAGGADGNWLTEDTAVYASSHPLLYGNPYLFTGRRWDSTTELYYYRMRDYTPDAGRFMQPDPAGYIDGMNLYAYCGNNPIHWIDPWGLWFIEAHRRPGRYGRGGPNDKFDYARLDLDFPATDSYGNRVRHFRPIADAYNDARAAARRHDARAFEYYMHEVQDYYSHYAVGYRARYGHWTHKTDDPTRPENNNRYRQAERMTRNLEEHWDENNPEPVTKSTSN
mgnify:CR=1 FL=1